MKEQRNEGRDKTHWVYKMAQQIKAITAKPDSPSLIPECTGWKEKTYSSKLSYDLHMCAVAPAYLPTQTLNRGWGMGLAVPRSRHEDSQQGRPFKRRMLSYGWREMAQGESAPVALAEWQLTAI